MITAGPAQRPTSAGLPPARRAPPQNYADAWFVGYTPELVTAVWVGYPDEQKAMTDVHGIKVTGGSFPALWAAFMKKALKDIPVSDFADSAGDGSRSRCAASPTSFPLSLCPDRR